MITKSNNNKRRLPCTARYIQAHLPVTYVSAKWHRPSIIGCVAAQVASRRPVTAQTHVISQIIRCVTCGAQSAAGTGVSPTTLGFPCHYHSTDAPLSSSSTRCSYQKDKRAKPGKLPKNYALSETLDRAVLVWLLDSTWCRIVRSTFRSTGAIIRHHI